LKLGSTYNTKLDAKNLGSVSGIPAPALGSLTFGLGNGSDSAHESSLKGDDDSTTANA